MFEIMKRKGFAVTFKNGYRVETDFGPLSESEHKNTSRQAFENVGKAVNAEIRIYNPEAKCIETRPYCEPNDYAALLSQVAGL